MSRFFISICRAVEGLSVGYKLIGSHFLLCFLITLHFELLFWADSMEESNYEEIRT